MYVKYDLSVADYTWNKPIFDLKPVAPFTNTVKL